MLTVLRDQRILKIRNILIIGVISFMIAYFFDQYYIYGKKWFFILELFG